MLRCERPICVGRVRPSMIIGNHPRRSVQGPDPANRRECGERAFNITRQVPRNRHRSPRTPKDIDDGIERIERIGRWRKRGVFLHEASPARMSNLCTRVQTIDGKV